MAILAAARMARRSAEDRVRLSGLFDAAQRSSTSTDASTLLSELQEHARLMLRSPMVRLSGAPPGDQELGCQVPTEPPQWLVADPRPGSPYVAADQQALDDFGTGYSWVAYLRRFPFDVSKIDRSFVTDLVPDDRACALLSAVLAMCCSLDVVSLAEGVEDLHQVALLRAAGCSVAQGYQFGRPMPLEQSRAVLRRGRVDVGVVPGPRHRAGQLDPA